MRIYITYDAHNGRADIKPALIEAGFLDRWKSENKTYYLPNTSLWRNKFTDTNEAMRLFNKVISELNSERGTNDKIVIHRFIAVEWTGWSGIPGERHS